VWDTTVGTMHLQNRIASLAVLKRYEERKE
jgi:hypothetical protein